MPKPKPELPINSDDSEQSRRFIDMVHAVEADEAPEALDQVMEKIITRKPPKKQRV